MKRWLALLVACGHPAPIAAPPKPSPVPPIDAAVAAVPPPDAADPCADLADDTARYELEMHAATESCSDDPEHCGPDFPGPPRCESGPLGIDGDSPFTATITCRNHDSTYGEPDCALAVSTTDTVAVDFGFEVGKMHEPVVDRARILDGYLVIELHPDNRDLATVVACRAQPLACTAPIATAGDDDTGTPWTTTLRLEHHTLILDTAGGNPPATALQPHPLRF